MGVSRASAVREWTWPVHGWPPQSNRLGEKRHGTRRHSCRSQDLNLHPLLSGQPLTRNCLPPGEIGNALHRPLIALFQWNPSRPLVLTQDGGARKAANRENLRP